MKVRILVFKDDHEIFNQMWDKEKAVIGRGKEADIRVPSEGISRKHLEITINQVEHFITLKDLGSKNGTRIGAKKLESGESFVYKTFYTPIELSYDVRVSLEVEMGLD